MVARPAQRTPMTAPSTGGFSARFGGVEEPESSKDLPLVEGNVFP